ncbi:MAG: LVIVD repeat-containing protein, partial [Xanthobacteraceae bacterium]
MRFRSATPCAVGIGGVVSLALMATSAIAQQQKVGDPPEAKNMRLVGYNDLQGRSAYQPTIAKQGDRYIAYIGHHGGTDDVPKPKNPITGQPEFNGTSIVDVTDPAHPKYLKHIPGLEGNYEAGGGQMTRVCAGASLPKGDKNKFYLLRVFGGQAHEIWDVTDPSNPSRIARIESGKDTHKNFWECDTGIAYLVSGVKDWRVNRMTQVYDLSDPAHPVHIRDFGMVGQEPGATGAVPVDLHGAISTGPQGNRVYFGYGTNKGGVLQIVDREKLLNGPK